MPIKIQKTTSGPAPALNKPVVLDETGKLPEKEPEKTLLQRYWWVLAIVGLLAFSGGGGDDK
jgi:hypothetical protein